MADLVVISGPPGAGKSTVGQRLARRFSRSVLVKGDEFFGFLSAGGILPWLPEAEEQNTVVQRAAALATGEFVRGGYDTVYEGVLGPWHLREFVSACGVEPLHYVVLLPSEATCVERVTTRENHGFKDVTATRRVHADFVRSDIDPRHVLSSPPREIDEVAELIRARLQDGSLRYS